jgi:predicted DNA-binding helix-hairpin-helix protein
MDAVERLKNLSAQMTLEPEGEATCPDLPEFKKSDFTVSHAQLPNGKQISLLKTLLTSACERNCYYCPFRSGRDFRRATLQPAEMARAFDAIYRGGVVEGLFLSSGIIQGGITTQDKLIDTAAILRRKYHYRGYLHLKLMPGAEKAQVEQAMRLADRVSVNLEAPNSHRLGLLAPKKQFLDELLQPLRWVEEIRRNQPGHLGWNGRWPSTVTQFVVGAVGESDLELLTTTERLYRQLRLRRAYFSPFHPVSDTPLENLPPTPVLREFRLYQASFLLRDYQFDLEDLPFQSSGDLPLHQDPKAAWAEEHLANRPIEINKATREELLRIPGIGPKGVAALLTARRQKSLSDLTQLKHLGIRAERAAPFILLNGHMPDRQLHFAI